MKAVKLLAGPKFIHVMAETDIIYDMWSLYNPTFGLLLTLFDDIHDIVGEQDDPQYKDMVTFIQRMTAHVIRKGMK